jgi:hypothetical protein
MPFFSPDGQWIGFFADGKLKKIAVQGGAVSASGTTSSLRSRSGGNITLCEAPNPYGQNIQMRWGIKVFYDGR